MAEIDAGSSPSLQRYWRERLAQHFEETYAGIRISKFPEDLAVYERLLWDASPAIVLELGVQWGGSTLWLRDRLHEYARYRPGPAGRIIAVDIQIEPARQAIEALGSAATDGITFLGGDLTDPGFTARVRAEIPSGSEVFVIEDAAHDGVTTWGSLQAFADLVRPGGFYMVEDTCVDAEGLRYEETWPRGCGLALDRWLREDSLGRQFRRRADLQAYGLTCHPGGLLQRSH